MEVDLERLGLLANMATHGEKDEALGESLLQDLNEQYQSSELADAAKSISDPEAIASLLRYIEQSGTSRAPPASLLAPSSPPASGAALMDQMLRAHPPPTASPIIPPPQQTRSGRISRPPPAPRPVPPVTPMIDTIAQVNRAILHNLMGGNKTSVPSSYGQKQRDLPPPEDITLPGGQVITSWKVDSTIGVAESSAAAARRWANGSSNGESDGGGEGQYDESNSRKRQRTTRSPSVTVGLEELIGLGLDATHRADGTKLTKQEKAVLRKEKNRRAAYESRLKKKEDMMVMEQRLEKLEEEYGILQGKYNVLEQQHARLQAHYASSQNHAPAPPPPPPPIPIPEAVPDYTIPTFNSSLAPPSIAEGAINYNGIQMSLDQYLAYTSGLASGMAAASGSSSAGPGNGQVDINAMTNYYDTFAGELLPEEEEEQDGDFQPSSPVYEDETPQQEDGGDDMQVDGAGEEGEGSDRTIREGEDGQTEGGMEGAQYDENQEGEFAEERDDDGTEYDDDDDDDMEFDDEELEDDEGLFLPIEDVPIPDGEQEALEAANGPPAPQAPPQAASSLAGSGAESGIGLDASMSIAQALAAAGISIYSIPGLAASLQGHVPAQPALGGGSSLGGGTPMGQSQLRGSAAGLGGGTVVAQPDRGFGIGRGAAQEMDPTTLIRQIYILNQSQQRAANNKQS